TGDGGKISLTAGTASPSTMLIIGDLDVRGVGAGNGGTITLSVNSNVEFEIDPNGVGTSGLHGNLLANGIVGGSVSVQNTGLGGINLRTAVAAVPVIQVTSMQGDGGDITLDAGGGRLSVTVDSAVGLNSNAGQGGDFAGGDIKLTGSGMAITGGPLPISANGINGGAGGTITVTNQGPAAGSEADIVVDKVAGGLTLFTTGGDRGGNGRRTSPPARGQMTI